MSVGGVGGCSGGGGGFGGVDLSKMASHMASKMMNDLDTNKDGSIDKKEFVAGLTAKGISADEASKQFDAIDAQKNGKISKTDIESAIKNGTVKPLRGGHQPGGAPPPGGQPPAGGATKSYDPADTNKDGTVSAQEALVYSLTHSTSSNSTSTATQTDQLGSSVNIKV
jgi:EF hand